MDSPPHCPHGQCLWLIFDGVWGEVISSLPIWSLILRILVNTQQLTKLPVIKFKMSRVKWKIWYWSNTASPFTPAWPKVIVLQLFSMWILHLNPFLGPLPFIPDLCFFLFGMFSAPFMAYFPCHFPLLSREGIGWPSSLCCSHLYI